ncbi:MAG: hypothetical protein H0X68_04910 [Chloroflexi bacterium]|nr:hypothetical protein [Chloroflexota bacterium]
MAQMNGAGRGMLPQFRVFTMLIGLGIVCGIAAKAADASEARWVNDLANSPTGSVFVLTLIGRFAFTPVDAALRSMAFFTATCLAYYGWSAYAFGFGGGPYFYLWVGLALTVVPILATGVRWACLRRGALPGLVMGTVAALTMADGAVWQLWMYYVEGLLSNDFPLHPVQAAVDLVVLFVIVGLLPRYGRTRLWASLAVLPMVVVTGMIRELFSSALLPI